MRYTLGFLVVLAMLGAALGFQVAPRGLATSSRVSQLSRHSAFSPLCSSSDAGTTCRTFGRRRTGLSMQEGEGGKSAGGPPMERGTMPSYEEEQEREFFKTDLDMVSNEEKVKDPIVFITLGWILGMFLVATAFIVNGVN